MEESIEVKGIKIQIQIEKSSEEIKITIKNESGTEEDLEDLLSLIILGIRYFKDGTKVFNIF